MFCAPVPRPNSTSLDPPGSPPTAVEPSSAGVQALDLVDASRLAGKWSGRESKQQMHARRGFWSESEMFVSGLWLITRGFSNRFCDTFGNPPLYEENSLWEALSVVSQTWSFPTALFVLVWIPRDLAGERRVINPQMGCPIGEWKQGRLILRSNHWFYFDPYPFVLWRYKELLGACEGMEPATHTHTNDTAFSRCHLIFWRFAAIMIVEHVCITVSSAPSFAHFQACKTPATVPILKLCLSSLFPP